jgi:type III secretion protein T
MLDELTRPLLIFLFCLVRPLAAFRVAPLLGASVMPPFVLNGIGMALALLYYYPASAGAPQEFSLSWALIPLVIKELIIGLVIGFFLGLLFWVAQSLGALIDNQRGASQAQGTDPLAGDQLSPFASFFFQFAAMLFFTSGAFVSFLGMLMESYALWPIFSPMPALTGSALYNLMLLQADALMRLAVLLAAPILALCFLMDFGLGLVNRFAPQLNVFVLSMPLKSAVVLAVLAVYGLTMLNAFRDGIHDMDLIFINLREALRS